MKKLLYTLLAFVTLINAAKSQAIDIKIGMWGVQNIYLHDGKIKYESNSGETPFNTVMQFQRYDGSTQVKAQAVYVLDASGSETAISDSIFVTTSDFTQATGTYWSKEFAKTAKLQPNNKAGVVKLKWRYWDTYSGTTPKWSSYYYASKTYQTVKPADPPSLPSGAVPVYSYYSASGNDHYSIPAPTIGDLGTYWAKEGINFYAYDHQVPGTVPIYSYRNDTVKDHYSSPGTEAEVNASVQWWISEGIGFYAFNAPGENRIPIYSYINNTRSDHYLSPDPNLAGSYWIKEGITFYAPIN